MFTGIISTVAKVIKAEKIAGSLFLTIEKPDGWEINPGDSIATDGVCLTVKEVGDNFYITELMDETLRMTSFGQTVPEHVNLERPLKLSDFLDGHLVQGHVDTTATIIAIELKDNSAVYTFAYSAKYNKYIVKKGSIAIDGISLTVIDVDNKFFSVSLVDYTLKNTTLHNKKVGDLVNIEFDMIGKYVAQLVESRS